MRNWLFVLNSVAWSKPKDFIRTRLPVTSCLYTNANAVPANVHTLKTGDLTLSEKKRCYRGVGVFPPSWAVQYRGQNWTPPKVKKWVYTDVFTTRRWVEINNQPLLGMLERFRAEQNLGSKYRGAKFNPPLKQENEIMLTRFRFRDTWKSISKHF